MGRLQAVSLAVVCLVLSVETASGNDEQSGSIVFSSDLTPAAGLLEGRIGVGRLHAFAADGRARIDYGAGAGSLPDGPAALSPDGRLLAFVRGGSEVWVADADGTNERRLLVAAREESFTTDGNGPPFFAGPSWSPDGRRLAVDTVGFSRCGDGSTKCADWYTVVVDLDGRRLGRAGGLNATWSPDGRFLLLLSGLFSLEHPGRWELTVEGPDGSVAARWGLNDKPRGACWYGGAWSPDGSRLVLQEGPCGAFEARLHLIRTRDWSRLARLGGCCATWLPGRGGLRFDGSKNGDVQTIVTRDGTRPRRIPATVSAQWSPSGERLVDIRRRHGRLVLVSARADGTTPRTLATVPEIGWVEWSRDSRRIAFTSKRGGAPFVAVVDALGGPVRVLHEDREGGYNAIVGWTASDRVVVWRYVTAFRSPELWVTRPDGSGLRRLGRSSRGALDATWSPDGSKLAFWRDVPPSPERAETLTIYVVPATGGPARRIVGGPLRGASAADPDWSPDGKHLVFARGWGRDRDLFVVGVDGRGLRRLTSLGLAEAPAWSPDGESVSFVRSGQLMVVPARGGEPRELLRRYCARVAWSPDGRRLAASCSDGLIVLDADGGNVRLLDPSGGGVLSWSPDGRRILYVHGGKLKVVGPDDGAAAMLDLDLHGATILQASWSRADTHTMRP